MLKKARRNTHEQHIWVETQDTKPQTKMAAWYFALPVVLAAAFCLFSSGYAVYSAGFFKKADILFFLLASVLPSVFFGYVIWGKGKIRLIVAVTGLSAFAVYILFYWKDIFKGLNSLILWIVGKVNLYYLQNFQTVPPFGMAAERARGELHLYFFICVFFGFILVSSISMKRGILWAVILLGSCFFVACNLCEEPQRFAVLLIFLAFFFVFSVSASRYKRGRTGGGIDVGFHKGGFLGSSNVMVFNSKGSGGSIFMWVNGLVVLITVVAILLFPKIEYNNPAPFEKFGQSPQEFVNNLQINGVPGFSSGQMGVNGGRLDGGSRHNVSYTTHLQLRSDILVPMFLKGYTGALYKGNKWDNLPRESYKELEGIINEYEENKITPLTGSKAYINMLNEYNGFLSNNESYARFSTLNIENIAANTGFAYLPYNNISDYFNSSEWSKSEFINDTLVSGRAKGRETYSVRQMLINYSETEQPSYLTDFQMYPFPYVLGSLLSSNMEYSQASMGETYLKTFKEKREADIAINAEVGLNDKEWAKQLSSKAFADYEEFVFENYLTIPEGMDRLKNDSKELYMSTNDVKSSVKNYLWEHAVYDYSPGSVPPGKDYVEYFLYENHRGYCTHFATAGTLLFRAMGIPARYVEGYVVTKNDITDGTTAAIPDANAHSWVEVWQGLLGWQPVEVTPGFSENSIMPPTTGAPLPEGMASSEPVSSEMSSEVSSETSSEEVLSSESVSSEPSSKAESSVSGGGDGTEAEKVEISGTAILLICIFAGLVLLAALLYFGRRLAKLRRKQQRELKDTDKSARYGYRFILAQVSMLGCRIQKNETEMQFAARLAAVEAMPLKGSVEEVIKTATTLLYGNTPASNEVRDKLWEFADSLSRELASSLPIVKRIIFMYLLWLG